MTGQRPAGADRFGRGHPVDLGERRIGDIARVDAGAQPAHQARRGRLPEDRRTGRVHADQDQVGEGQAQRGGDPRGVATRPDGGDQDVDAAQLRDEFGGQRSVGRHIVGVVVLVGAPRPGRRGEQFGHPFPPGLLPAAGRVRGGDGLDPGAVGDQGPADARFEPGVGDHGDRVPEGDPGQGQAQSQGAAGGFDDGGAVGEVAALPGAGHHVQAGAVLDAAGVGAFELGPEAAARIGEGLTDPEHRRVAHQLGRPTGGHRGRGVRGDVHEGVTAPRPGPAAAVGASGDQGADTRRPGSGPAGAGTA